MTYTEGSTMKGRETAVTQKVQVSIPREIRKAMGLKPRDRVRFDLDGASAKLTRATSRILAGYGAVTPKQKPEDFRAVREQIEQAIAADVVAKTDRR